MDPDANIQEQCELSDEAEKIWDACPDDGEFTAEQQKRLSEIAIRMAELIKGLDGWIIKGGFSPQRWTRKGDKPNSTTVWVSVLIPEDGADAYDGARVQVELTQENVYRDLAEWLNIEFNDIEDTQAALNEAMEGDAEEGFGVRMWKVEEQQITGGKNASTPEATR